VEIRIYFGCCALLLLFACFERNPPQPPQIYINHFNPDLVQTDYGWLYKNQPFSGYMVERERNGQIVYQLPIIKGKENGRAIGMYNTGEKLMTCNFVEGKREGIFQQWWPNGRLRYLFTYHQGNYQGTQWVYFPNGRVQGEKNYSGGKEEGVQKIWDSTGKLLSNYAVKNNILYGTVSSKDCMPVIH